MKSNMFWKGLTRNAPDNPGGSPAAAEGAEPEAQTPSTPDYGWMPEEYRSGDAPDFDGFKNHYQELLAEQTRRAEETVIPDTYDFALPDGFDLGVDLPEGDLPSFIPDADNPLLGEFGAFLKENGISQEVATGLTGMLARYNAQQYAEKVAPAMRDFETLGATEAARMARVGSVQRALETKLPKDQAQALMDACFSAAGVKALENILKPRGGTTPAPTANGAEWENLTPMERLRRANEQIMQS